MASGGMDTLPHNGAVITLLAVTGLTHRQAYKDVFAITIIKTLAVFVVIGVFYATGLICARAGPRAPAMRARSQPRRDSPHTLPLGSFRWGVSNADPDVARCAAVSAPGRRRPAVPGTRRFVG